MQQEQFGWALVWGLVLTIYGTSSVHGDDLLPPMPTPAFGEALVGPLNRAACARALAASEVPGEVARFLNAFPVIRVGVVHAPSFGHQQSAIQVATRLRELGYKNQLQIIYDQYTEEKLQILVPGLVLSTSPTFHPGMNATFLSRKYFDENVREVMPVQLGFLGAEDNLPYNNGAKPADYGVSVLVRLQPMDWKNGYQSIDFEGGEQVSLKDLNSLPHLFTPPSEEEVQRLAHRVSPQLGDLLTEPMERAVFYNAHSTRVPALRKYVRSILAAQELRPDLFDSGVAVLLLSEFSPFNRENFMKGLQTEGLTDQVELMSVQEIRPEDLLIAKGKVVVFDCQGLAPALIRAALMNTTLAPAIAGKATRNFLLQTGQPFMETDFPDLPEELGPLPSAFLSAYMDFSSDRPTVLSIRNFILASRTAAGAELRSYFSGFRMEPFSARDKTTAAVLRLMEILRSRDPQQKAARASEAA